ncbi:GntR family transcriptional regulator [Escherichia coli]|nr:GntR family transcriptional regulator [Escherichia coli]NUD08427.1 GntR family transcriptional regulator [Escherichia coli]NUD77958.1 GntR family transcriptional regulator [Escherichia coli]NUE43305.1 GntR family transcriptional regulator [Escherichia coli]
MTTTHCLIPPGTLLSEKAVSGRFSVSRQPVREAFIKLAEGGLVQIRPQRGTFVTRISQEAVRNGCFVREAIERAIARRAACLITSGQIQTLEELLEEQKKSVAQHKINDFFRLDDAFHHCISVAADCERALETVETIRATMDRVRYMSLDHTSSLSMLLEQHGEICQALKKRDETATDRIMQQHLSEISRSITLIREENEDWFCE